MTEKRFTRKEFAIYEKGNPICMTLRDVDKRLNELWEENEQLKKEIIAIEKRADKVYDENEQLKERVKDWHQRTFKAHEYFNILEKVIDEVCNDDISNQIWKEYEKREKLIE